MIPYTKPPLFLSNIFLAPHFNMCYNRKELKIIQKEVGITFVFVTHDQEEALTMSDTIIVMNKGIIQQTVSNSLCT